MAPLTRRERLRRCYYHEEIDRPAVYSRTGYPPDDPTYDRLRAYLHEHAEHMLLWPCGSDGEGAPQSVHEEAYSSSFKRRVVVLHTPTGDLRRTELVGLQGQPGLHESYFIKSPEDAERYLSLPSPAVSGDGGLASFQQAEAQVADRGVVNVSLGLNPAGFVAELCGSETFALMSLTDRALLHALCQRRAEVLSRRVRHALGLGIGPLFSLLGQEYVAPPLHGPHDFVDFNVRYDRSLIDLVHDAGGRVHVHCHGPVATVFDGFLDMGTDILHPCEPPPMGDITATEVRQRARGRLCLDGNIQINRLYENTPDEVRSETRQLITDAFDGGGLIVSASASPYVPGQGEVCLPQYQAMVGEVVQGGRGG